MVRIDAALCAGQDTHRLLMARPEISAFCLSAPDVGPRGHMLVRKRHVSERSLS